MINHKAIKNIKELTIQFGATLPSVLGASNPRKEIHSQQYWYKVSQMKNPYSMPIFLILHMSFYLKFPLNIRILVTFSQPQTLVINTINSLRIVNYNSTNNQLLCLEYSFSLGLLQRCTKTTNYKDLKNETLTQQIFNICASFKCQV